MLPLTHPIGPAVNNHLWQPRATLIVWMEQGILCQILGKKILHLWVTQLLSVLGVQ